MVLAFLFFLCFFHFRQFGYIEMYFDLQEKTVKLWSVILQ